MIEFLKKEFRARSDENGIPLFTNSQWIDFRNKYDKQDIRIALADYIHEDKVKFPFKKIVQSYRPLE